MIVTIRDVSARCTSCGGTDFQPLVPGALHLATRLACTKCNHILTYRDLLESIGEQAMHRANEALAKLKKASPRRKKTHK
jgi:hypothetical protein